MQLPSLVSRFIQAPFVRKFVTDFVETGAAAVVALNLAIPGSLGDARAEGLLVVTALAGALIAAGRRAFPAAKDWVLSQFAA